MERWVLGITGASGSIYGVKVLEGLIGAGAFVHVIISSQAFPIIRQETGVDWSGESESTIEKRLREHVRSEHIVYHDSRNLAAPVSSVSFKTRGMILAPCSMKTLASIAAGFADNLISRAADVCLKEGRKLVLSPREMPFSAIHLENMLKLSRLGVMIAPPVPAFYQGPKSIDDLANFVAGKILDAAGVENGLFRRWSGWAGEGSDVEPE